MMWHVVQSLSYYRNSELPHCLHAAATLLLSITLKADLTRQNT